MTNPPHTYGTWQALTDPAATTPEDTLTATLGEWLDDHEIHAIADAYRHAINEALPHGIRLTGSHFTGPAPTPRLIDQYADYGYPLTATGLDISAIVDTVSLWDIVDRHTTT